MAIYQIQKMGAEVLRETAAPVAKVDDTIRRLLDDMADTMYDADGVGLAAPQIGISKRVIVVDVGDGLIELVNPKLIRGKGTEIENEACLSVVDFSGPVARYKVITVEGLDREGHKIVLKARDWKARALQHEMDHLDGVLFVDRVIRTEAEKSAEA